MSKKYEITSEMDRLRNENLILKGKCQAYQTALRIAEGRERIKTGHRDREIARIVRAVLREALKND